jgi:hypothetical protein
MKYALGEGVTGYPIHQAKQKPFFALVPWDRAACPAGRQR